MTQRGSGNAGNHNTHRRGGGPAWAALLALLLMLALSGCADPSIPILKDGSIGGSTNPKDVTTVMQIVAVLTVLTVAPSILIMTTSFTRIIIVLSFLRRALATQQLPPNQIMVGLSLILTFLVMGPTWERVYAEAIQPYAEAQGPNPPTLAATFEKAKKPVMEFMARQTRHEDYMLFAGLSGEQVPEEATLEQLSLWTMLPAFTISELSRAFVMGFILYLPFLVIDLVISTTLISMGMLVLPPILISLPFKILLFVLVDGWHMIVGSLVQSFY